MRKRRSVRAAALVFVVAAAAAAALTARNGADSTLPLKLVENVPLPGPSNRFDYTSLDPETGRLYIAHMDAGELLAFDIRQRRVVARDRLRQASTA